LYWKESFAGVIIDFKNLCMKTTGLFFIFMCFISAAKAQEQFIEVVVTDSMMVEPREWNYFLLLQGGDEPATSEAEANKPQSKDKGVVKTNPPTRLRQQTLDSIRMIATTFGGEIIGDPNSLNFTMLPKSYMGNTDPQYLNIKFTTRLGIEGFVKAINKRGDIEGRITATTHPDLPPFSDRLNARIITMAKQKAEKLAQLAGRKAGPVILISEVAEPSKNLYQGLFEKMIEADRSSWLPGWVAQSVDSATDKIKLEKTLRIRFALL
jgi:hypothetical protein